MLMRDSLQWARGAARRCSRADLRAQVLLKEQGVIQITQRRRLARMVPEKHLRIVFVEPADEIAQEDYACRLNEAQVIKIEDQFGRPSCLGMRDDLSG